MAVTQVTMPQLGESVTEGTIGKWLKQPGDAVEKYESLAEVITDKVNAEIPSPIAGVIKELKVPEGATVPVGTEIVAIAEGGDAEAEAHNVNLGQVKGTGLGGRVTREDILQYIAQRQAAPAAPAPAAPAPPPTLAPAMPAVPAPAPGMPAPTMPMPSMAMGGDTVIG